MDATALAERLAFALEGLPPATVPDAAHRRGKVRDIWELDGYLLIVTSDRVSAFDRVLTTIPCKGEVLNRISLFWFEHTRDIVPNHVLGSPSPRSMLVRKCRVVPIEVVVRGYLTGSAWRDYRKSGVVSGIRLAPGLRENERFEQPLLTPTTKEGEGAHDRPISVEEILESGIVAQPLWRRIEEAARRLFARGTELAAARGLILVDTKYEFGLDGEELVLVDELHTPDSSRFWYGHDYQRRFERGEAQHQIDKEYLRRWLMEHGFAGEGEPPRIPDEVRVETARRYIEAYEAITGEAFEPRGGSAAEEAATIRAYLAGRR